MEARGKCRRHYRRELRALRDAATKSHASPVVAPLRGVLRGPGYLTLPTREPLTEVEFERLLSELGRDDRYSQWWTGDAVAQGERRYGRTYELAQKMTGLSYGTLKNRAYVARRVHPEVRDPELEWSVHVPVASIRNEAEQREWLRRARDGRWNQAELRRQMAEQQAVGGGSQDVPEPDYRCPSCGHGWHGSPKPLPDP